MKRFFFLLSLLISFSIGQIWAAADVTYDFTGSGWTASSGTLSNGTVSFTGAGSANFKMSSGYFMMGKSDAYINFPTYAKAVAKIVVTGRSGASTSTKMNIYVGTTAVSTETTGCTGTNTYEIAAASQAAGTTYTLKVTSSHNAQITKIEIYYAEEVPAGTCATPIFSLDEGTYEGAQSVTISCSTTDATIYYTTDGSTPTTSSSVYSAAIPVAADMTIKAYAVKDGSDDSEVATASYTITEAPDVTLDFTSNTEWKFPNGSSNKKVDRNSYTSGDHTIYVAGSTGNGYYFSSSYLLLGKTGAYIELPEFTSPIEKIVVVGTSGGSSGVKFNIYDGTTAVSTEVTGCQNVSQEFVITNPAANKAYKVQVTSNANLQVSKIKIYFGEAPAVAKPTISGDENFVTSTTVTISHADADHIYYTTNGDAPTTSSTEYLAPFTVDADGTTTVKAIAVKGSDVSAVAEKTFTKATPITVTEAIAAIPNQDDVVDNQFVSGIVCTAGTSVNASGQMTYYISDDGSETSRLQIYLGKNLNNTAFSAVSDLAIGDRVVVFGQLKNYKGTKEMNSGNYLISKADPAVAAPTFTPDGGGFMGETDVTITCATANSTIYYTLDGSAPSKSSTQYTAAIHLTATTTIKAIAFVGDDASLVITKTFTLTAPMTVAEALAALDTENPKNNVAVAGIISTAPTSNPNSGRLTYYISDDGSTTDQLEVYLGFGLNGASFSAKTDLQVGDEVTVFGNLKIYNETKEFDAGNRLLAFNRPTVAVSSVSLPATASVEVGKTVTLTATVLPENASDKSITWTIESGSDKASVDGGVVTGTAEGTAVIRATSAADNTKYAECTVTVTAASAPDTRNIANSPATFTETSGDLTPADITYAANQGGASTAPAIQNNGIRLYQISGSNTFGGFITLTAKLGCTIDEVQITTTSKYATTVAYSKDGNENLLGSESVEKSGSYTTGTGLNVSSVNILNLGTGSNGRLEIASIKVYYTGEAAAIDHYELGGTYATEFEVGDEFNHNGLIVYAAFDASGENKSDITSSCTFSTPDMSTEGDKTIEITYNDAVVKSYTITVNASTDTRKVANSPETFTAVSGDMNPADITFASYKGGAGNDPYLASGSIRLYQISGSNTFGGFITLKAKKGCTIDQVKITTTNSYATTVAYSVDGNENLLGSESVAKSSDYSTPSGLNVESVNIVNKGTGSSGRLEIASIKVWYTGDALPVHHYILGGTYATEFEQYGEFNYEGLTVTAAYDAGETITEAVTGFIVEADLSTAGAKKAEVMLNNVKIAEYDITVNASSKVDPELAYSPASVILTLGDALSAPTFSNTHNVSPITYSSDKPAVATVDAEGNIALAGGTGVAVITASFAGDDDYIESEATFTITVNEPAEDLSGTWVLATSVAAGDRIIIAGTYNSKTMAMGKQNSNNRAAVLSTLDNDVLTPGNETKVFTLVDAGEGLFAIQASNGKYLNAAGTGDKNYLKEADDYDAASAKWTITFDENGANIVATSTDNRNVIRYNSSNGSELFSCYAAGGQRAINIYKIGSYQRSGLTVGNYGTICLPNGGTISGAKLFDLEYYDGANTLYFLEVNGNAMVAGRPYIFLPSGTSIEVTYTDNVNAAAGSFNGLVGSYTQETITSDAGNYILYQNAYYLVNSTAYVGANRAYIHMAGVPTEPYTPQAGDAPRRRVAMAVNGEQVATGIDAINASDKPMKVMIDGKLYIIRAGQMYDMTGSKVK